MNEIKQVCKECGIAANVLTCLKKYGQPPKELAFICSTTHKGKCDYCKSIKDGVTETRDYFYPDFSLLDHAYNIYLDNKAIENKKYTVIFNARDWTVKQKYMSYEQIIEKAGFKHGTVVTVTFYIRGSKKGGGTLTARQAIHLQEGLIINAVVT